MNQLDALMQARKIIERASNQGKRLAVFIRKQNVVAVDMATASYEEKFESPTHKFIGSYDASCDPQWLADDLMAGGL